MMRMRTPSLAGRVRRQRHRTQLAGAVAMAVLLLPMGCAWTEADPTSTGASSGPGPSLLPTATTSSPAAPWTVVRGSLSRCGPQPQPVADSGFVERTIRARGVGRISAVTRGRGSTALILLHEQGGNGLCGWLPFMASLEDRRVRALAIDLCNFGASDCRGTGERSVSEVGQVAVVQHAAEYARRHLGAQRVVLLGASMGGRVAMLSAASDDQFDAAVDLSGAMDARAMAYVDRGRAIGSPVLVAMARTEETAARADLRDLAENAPAGSRLLVPAAGHGYELLNEREGPASDFERLVRRWIFRHLGAAP